MISQMVNMMKKLNLRIKITLILTSIIVVFLIGTFLIIRNVILTSITNDLVETIVAEQTEVDNGVTYLLDTISPVHVEIEKKLDISSITSSNVQDVFYETMLNINFDKTLFSDVLLVYEDVIYSSSSYTHYSTNLNQNFIDKIKSSNNILEEGPIVNLNNNLVLLIGKKMTSDISLVYTLKIEAINNILSINNEENRTALIISNNTIFGSNKTEYIGKEFFDNYIFYVEDLYQIVNINGVKTIIISTSGKNSKEQYDFNWQYINLINYDSLTNNINTLNKNIIIVSVFSAIISAILAYFISAGLVNPIQKLSKKIKTDRQGDEGKLLNNSGDDIVELENSFNEMIERITNLIEENQLQAENKRQLELYALQVQINPHFLYNTLDAIAWLAKLKKQPQIEQLVLALAQFFRISLHKGDKFITVGEEIELIKNYIVIEQIRFPDKFKIEYEIEEEIVEYESMKLILQPLIENAIKHGISEIEEEGKIIVKAYKQEDFIFYEVIDNGKGFDPNQIKQNKAMSGYGFKNVDERLRLEYGIEAGVKIESFVDKGTKVTIKYPIRKPSVI